MKSSKTKKLTKLVEIEPRYLHSEQVEEVEKHHQKEMLKIIKKKPFDVYENLEDLDIDIATKIVLKSKVKNKPIEEQKRVVSKYRLVYWQSYNQGAKKAEMIANKWIRENINNGTLDI